MNWEVRLRQQYAIAVRPEWLEQVMTQLHAAHPDFPTWPEDRVFEKLFTAFLFCDLNQAGAAALPANTKEMHKEVLKGKFVLQLDEVINMAAAARERYTDQSGNRCLKFALTDGCQQVVGVEHAHLPAFAWDCPAGTKVIIHNVPIRRGLLLLGPDNTALLGGQVERLEAARQRAVAAWTKPVVGRPAGSAARDIFAEARQAAWAPGAPTGAAAQQPTGGPQAGVETAGAAAGAQGGNPQQQAPPPAAAAALFMVPAGGPPAGAGAGGGGGTAGAALPAQPQHPMHLQQQQQQTASNAVVRGPVPGAGGPGMATAAAAGPALQHPQGNPQTPHNFQPPPPPPPQQQQQGWQQQQQQQQDRQEQWPTQPRGSTPWTQAVAIPTAAAAPPPPATAWLGRSTDATHPHAHANRPAASFGVLTTAAAAAGSSRTAGGGGAAAVRAVREDGGGYDVRTAAAAAVAVRGEQGDSSAYAMEVMTISDSGSGESPPRASINQQLQGPGDGINPHAVSVPPPQNQHQHPFANDPPPPLPPPQQQQRELDLLPRRRLASAAAASRLVGSAVSGGSAAVAAAVVPPGPSMTSSSSSGFLLPPRAAVTNTPTHGHNRIPLPTATAAAAAAAGGGSSAGVYGAGAGAVGSVASRKPALPLARSSPGPTVSSLGSAGRSGGGGGVGGSIAAAHSPTKSVSVLGCGAVHRRAEGEGRAWGHEVVGAGAGVGVGNGGRGGSRRLSLDVEMVDLAALDDGDGDGDDGDGDDDDHGGGYVGNNGGGGDGNGAGGAGCTIARGGPGTSEAVEQQQQHHHQHHHQAQGDVADAMAGRAGKRPRLSAGQQGAGLSGPATTRAVEDGRGGGEGNSGWCGVSATEVVPETLISDWDFLDADTAAASGAAAAVAQPHRVQCAPGAAAPGAVNGSRLGGAIHPGAPGVGAWSWQCGAVAAATGHGSSGGGEEQAAADDCDGMVEGHHSRDLPPQPLAAAAAAPDGSFFKGPEQDGYTHAQAQPPPQPANHAGAVLLCQVPDILQPEPDSDTPVTFPVTLDVYGLFHALEGTHAIIEDGTAIVEAEFADGALATILAGVTAPGGFSPGAPIGLEELQAMADSPDPAVQAHGQELALRVMEFIRDFSGMIRLEYRSPLPTQPPLIIQLTNDGDGGNGGDRPGGPNTSRDVVTAADDATAGQRGRQADGDSCQLYEEFLQGVGVLDASGDGDM